VFEADATMTMQRRGFSLIELLVVAAIIAVLVALLIPALQRARAAAALTQCKNNLRQIAIAMHDHHHAHRTLPVGMWDWGWGTWQVGILPYVDEEHLFTTYANYHGKANPGGAPVYYDPINYQITKRRFAVFTCPADQVSVDPLFGLTTHNYAVNMGNTDRTQRSPYDGVTFGGAPFADRRGVKLTAITDGSSHTLLAAEVVQGHGADLRGFTWNGVAAGFESFYGPNASDPDLIGSGGACNNARPNPPCVMGTFHVLASRSRHEGGVQAALCDGSVRWVADTIALASWRALSTSQGAETLGD
jgi:prepilin-type N-terminal cleavage/methylation domain-containing protein